MRAFITGANRGIGLEFVRQLVARGDHIFATCRQPDQATALIELQEQYADLITIVPLDVSDPRSIEQSFGMVRTYTDTLDLLVNNAATAQDDGKLGSLDLKTMQTILTINSIAPMLVIQQYLDLIKAGNNPKIINLSSGAGSLTRRNTLSAYSYSASKTALNMYTRNLVHALKDSGIIVVAISPGWVKTDMGGPNAQISVEVSIANMVTVIDSLTLADSGGFLSYTGETLPW